MFEASRASFPLSAITGVVLIPKHALVTTRLEAGITTLGAPAGSAAVPFALAPVDAAALPANLQYTTGPDYGATITNLMPLQYTLSIRSY